MSKHRETALILLGIAVCAGFLLTAPAVAGSGQGLMALESGELLSFSLDELSAAENESEPSGVSIPPDEVNASEAFPVLPNESVTPNTAPLPPEAENASDVFPVLPDEGNTSDAVPVFPDEENASGEVPVPTGPGVPDSKQVVPGGPIPAVDAPQYGTDGYDDERLIGLISTASIRLMKLSMEHAYALYQQDADAAAVAADELHAFSVRLLREVQPLQVSPERQPVKDEFVRSLEAYSAASETLLHPTDADGDAVPAAFRDLATASEGLETVNRQAGEAQPAPGTRMSAISAGTPAASAATGPVLVAPPEKVLPLLDRYTYDDPSGENMVSLLAESTRTATEYQEVPVNASTPKVEAGEGRMFLLVAVKSTNLGHRGDSDLYTIETPGRDAFVLECQGTTFAPMEVPPFTTLGESFDRKTLERYESLKGYLYFDVPATLDVSGATLRADLGDAGMPAWELGKKLGEESGDAV
ncbi:MULTISPECIES: hypothetical protein [unclassified Methanoculleus]|uniref:hypothetical protein n=1 Tax=unclassified Methanoculleus TaxID=2619537 RepID=UPI0025E742AE|nr:MULTISPECIES: hypothetical protein [unclassified Methanoculleus]